MDCFEREPTHGLEAPPRSGFFERREYEAVRRHLRPDLQVAVTIAYTYGWRMRSEVLALERRHLDLEAGTMRLDPGMTKNGEGRVVYLTLELKALPTAQVDRVRTLERELGRIVPWLFPHLGGSWVATPIREFRKACLAASRQAGVDRYHIVSPADLQAAATKLTGITTGITADSNLGGASEVSGRIGEPSGTRTRDSLLKRQELYRLS